MLEWQLAILATFLGVGSYAAIRSAQHRTLSRAYGDAHRACHEDRGYFRDRYTGLDREACQEIADRFREAEEQWWMFGGRKHRATTERRMAEWYDMILTEPKD